jgi:hypothetical protein
MDPFDPEILRLADDGGPHIEPRFPPHAAVPAKPATFCAGDALLDPDAHALEVEPDELERILATAHGFYDRVVGAVWLTLGLAAVFSLGSIFLGAAH